MAEMGDFVMTKLGLLGSKTTVLLDGGPRLGRMLYYGKCTESAIENPLWCGSHFDHGLFTALLPAFYFLDGNEVVEPIEAGLYIKTPIDGIFKKVVANDHEVLLFQVGEFGQLVTNDEIRATEHCVHKASGHIERYTMALFFEPPYESIIHSSSELTKDARYGGVAGEPCSYLRWHEESSKRYIVNDSIEGLNISQK
jgi:isopenicillin N synthase-like dioxygenase